MGAVEEATAEAAKHGDRSEKLSALVAEARVMIEQAKTEKAERARAAAEEAAAAAALNAVAEAKTATERIFDADRLGSVACPLPCEIPIAHSIHEL